MDTNKKHIEKLNKLTEEICEFYDLLPFLSGEYIEKYDSILRVLNFEKMGINKIITRNVSKFEREIDFLKSKGFNRLLPFHSVICQIRYGKSYTIQEDLKQINIVITTIRILRRKVKDLWNSRPVHK